MSKKGATSFTEAADSFFGEVGEQLKESVSLKDVNGIERATAIAELVYKVNQSLKLMKEEKEKKPNAKEEAKGAALDLTNRMAKNGNI